jgi:hypothetical protein
MSPLGQTRKSAVAIERSGLTPILLQKSKVAPACIFGETLDRDAIDDSDNLSGIAEVAYEFSVRR